MVLATLDQIVRQVNDFNCDVIPFTLSFEDDLFW